MAMAAKKLYMCKPMSVGDWLTSDVCYDYHKPKIREQRLLQQSQHSINQQSDQKELIRLNADILILTLKELYLRLKIQVSISDYTS